MDPHPDLVTRRTCVGLALLGLLFAAVAGPIVLWVGPASKPGVVRIASGLFGAVVLFRLARGIRYEVAGGDGSQRAVARPSVPPSMDPSLQALLSGGRFGLDRSRVPAEFWARLKRVRVLCRDGEGPSMPTPDNRPTWRQAEAIIRKLEERQ